MARRALAQQSAAAQARVRPPSDRALRAAQRAAHRHDKKLVAPIGPRSKGVSSRAKRLCAERMPGRPHATCSLAFTVQAAWGGTEVHVCGPSPHRSGALTPPPRYAARQALLGAPAMLQVEGQGAATVPPSPLLLHRGRHGRRHTAATAPQAAASAAALRPETLQHSATARATAESSRCGRLTRTRAAGAAQQRAPPSAAPLAQRLLLCGLGPAAAAPPRPPVRWPLARSTGAGGTAAAALAAAPRRRSRSRRAPARRRR